MAKQKYLPAKEQEKSTWQKTFGIKIGGYKAKYNVQNPDEIRIIAGGNYAEYLLDTIDTVDEYKKSWIDYKNHMFFGPPEGVDPGTITPPAALTLPPVPATGVPAPGIFPHATSIGNAIKKNINYVEIDGQDMGLEGPEKEAPDLVNGQPTLEVVLKGVVVWILWKKGLFDGVWIEVDRGDGNWVKLGEDYEPDFADTMALPAQATQWRYRAWYVMSDANGNAVRVGKESQPASIIVKA